MHLIQHPNQSNLGKCWKGLLLRWEQKSDWQSTKIRQSEEALNETGDTLRGDKPTPVIFPSRKLYAETDHIWFENINSIYLRKEMRCWVKGGAAGFKHNRNQTPFSGLLGNRTHKESFSKPSEGFLLHADFYLVCWCISGTTECLREIK